MTMTNDTSLIIPVAAAAFVQPFRIQYLHRPGVTMPPHITVRSPFKSLGELTEQDYHTLTTLFASFSPFVFTLGRLARFAETGVLYLAPEPVEPFMALYQALFARYPVPPENHSSVVFHLTLARRQPTNLDQWEAEFHRLYDAQLPIKAMATEVSLYEEREEQWFKITSFPLGKPDVF
jgi:2'-5' RNA ligase